MEITYSQPLNRAWQRARLVLFSPFDLGKWLVVGFAAWLANLGGGTGGGFSGHTKVDASELPNLRHVGDSFQYAFDWASRHLIWLPLIGLGLFLVIGLVLFVLWLSSRGKFIFLDNVVHDRAEIARPWKRYRRLGDSLFLWRLGLVAVGLCITVILFGSMFGLAAAFRSSFLSPLVLAPTILLGLGLAIMYAFIALYLEGFVIPIMYRFDLKATEAWRVFLDWWHQYTVPFVVYGLFVVGLYILFATAVIVVGFATCCIGFFLLALPYVGTVLVLPAWVTYRALSIEFLAQFDPRFDLFAAALEEQEVAAQDVAGDFGELPDLPPGPDDVPPAPPEENPLE